MNRSLYRITNTELSISTELDGEDLSQTILGREKKSRQQPIFWRRPPDRPGTKQEDNPDLAVREGAWKYYVNYDGSEPQLYHLVDDVSETKNIIEKHKETAKQLHSQLMKWNEGMPKDAGDPKWKTQRN